MLHKNSSSAYLESQAAVFSDSASLNLPTSLGSLLWDPLFLELPPIIKIFQLGDRTVTHLIHLLPKHLICKGLADLQQQFETNTCVNTVAQQRLWISAAITIYLYLSDFSSASPNE